MNLRNIPTVLHSRIALFLCACIFSPSPATAQKVEPVSQIAGEPWTGERAVVESVAEIMARQSLTVADPRRFIRIERKRYEELHPTKRHDPAAPTAEQWPPRPKHLVAQPRIFSPQTIGTNFLGVDAFDSAGFFVVPPDSMGAVGPSQIFVLTNGQIKIFDKSGVLGSLNADLTTFFSSVLTPSQFVSDPHVRFDRLSQRWFVTAISIEGTATEPPNKILIAVSSGPAITSNSSFSFFSFQHDQVGPRPNQDTGGFADYDTLGVDRFALYIGANIFKLTGVPSLSTTGFVIRKSDLLNGILTVFPFRRLGFVRLSGAPNGGGMDTPQGVNNDDPQATEGYFIGVDLTAFSKLNLRRVSNPGGIPSISGSDIAITVPTTAFPIPQVQPSGGFSPGTPLDFVSDRLFAAAVHTNKLTGVRSLWTAHNIEVNASGVGTAGGGRNGSRWYEITNLSSTPTLNQAGTLVDPSNPMPLGFWIPSVAMTGQGHMVLGASRASTLFAPEGFAGVAVTGRLSSDPLGATQFPPAAAQLGENVYDAGTTDATERWGDYSQTVVDPADDMTVWTFQEYANVSGLWSVRVIQVKAPPPPALMSANPSSVQQGKTGVQVTVTGASASDSAFFDPGPDPQGPGFPNHIAASVSGAVASSTTFNNTTSVSFSLSTVCAVAGPRDVTITNPDGQSTTGVGLITIDFLPTTTSLSSGSSMGFVGQPVTFVATVSSATTCPSATGTVTFKEGATVLGTRTLVGGQASFTISTLGAGVHNITAQYGGDFRYSGSISSPLAETIVFATSTSLSSSQNPSALGASVTFTATVSNVPDGTPAPAGTVTFTDNGSAIGPPVTLSAGVASRSVTLSSAISHFTAATYNGDSLHNPSTSPTLHQRVQAPGVGLSVGSNLPNPVTIGKLVTITTVITNTGSSAGVYTFGQVLTGRFVLVSASPSNGSCAVSGSVNCNSINIPAGQSATVTTQLRALFGHDIVVTNSATAATQTTSTTNNVRVRFRPFHF